MYIDLPCQSCDKASIASARGSGTRPMNWGRCVLWTVANLSTTGVLHSLNIRFMTSGWRPHSVVMGWFGQDNRSAITFRQPGMCLALRVMSLRVLKPQKQIHYQPLQEVGMGPALFVDVSYNSGIVCSNQNTMALLYYSPVIEGQFYRPTLQYIDVELAFGTCPYTRNLRIPHVGAPALGRGVCENGELCLERSDRDS